MCVSYRHIHTHTCSGHDEAGQRGKKGDLHCSSCRLTQGPVTETFYCNLGLRESSKARGPEEEGG